jgi:hypothetical protein
MSEQSTAGGNRRARRLATLGAALSALGTGLFIMVLLIGAQGLFFSVAPVAIGAVILGLLLAVASWSQPLSKVMVLLGVPALILGVLAFAFAYILASGFAGVK